MAEEINKAVSVITVFDAEQKKVLPKKVKWNHRIYNVREVNLHYTKTLGSVLHHLFSVTDGNVCLHLSMNSQTLTWTLLEVSE